MASVRVRVLFAFSLCWRKRPGLIVLQRSDLAGFLDIGLYFGRFVIDKDLVYFGYWMPFDNTKVQM
jgi:hypothetical protein